MALTYLTMFSVCATILVVRFLVGVATASSFYDNPEQDPLPVEETPEDLHNKWDFEVHLVSFVIRRL